MAHEDLTQWLRCKTQEHVQKHKARKRRFRQVPHSSELVFDLTMERFGLQLKANRLARGWAQHQLAMRCKIPKRMIARLERGKHFGVSVEMLTALARAFGCALAVGYVSTASKVTVLKVSLTDEELYVPSFNEETTL